MASKLFSSSDLELPELIEGTLKNLFVFTWIINSWACIAFGSFSQSSFKESFYGTHRAPWGWGHVLSFYNPEYWHDDAAYVEDAQYI